MKQFKLVDNILGWLAFLIAAFVYCSTVEPTASFWDCPEFIVTGYKLEIGHPPGAPFFMLTANLFSQFASDPSQVALMVNMMSALLSATCILFLFWSITHLTRKLILKDWNDLTLSKMIAIEASGMVGALIYTFSDTFWFSAVEGEVYAYSSAFTAVVFWLILKWEDHADEPHSDRWLVLIMYMTGLSIGVHLLNLLCVPAIVLVYYYRKFPNADLKGSLMALAVSFAIVAGILYGVVPGIITVGGWFELFFVNTLGCPFNTGEIIYIILLVGTVIWAIYESYTNRSTKRSNVSFLIAVAMLGVPFVGHGWAAVVTGIVVLAALWFVLNFKKDKAALVSARMKNTVLLCMLMLMIGYSSYALIVIRSSANTPMDQNSPEDIFTLGSYLSRDQYGDSPLLYGQAYTSQVQLDIDGNRCIPRMKEGAPVYQRKEKASTDEKDSYFIVRHKNKYVYAQNMLFPRMHSSDHAQAYESWMGGVNGTEVPYDNCGETIMVKMPSQLENIRFFLSYQCNFMYWRYFMWNFAGRQNDIQGNGELEHGNWITGIPFIDNMMLGDQSLLPDELKENKGHNVFYCLPLLLGLIGLFWQAYRGQRGIRQFWVVFFLFFMTGLAIVIYLNQTPMQPRERDYAYAGSFYAFAIWCGMGVAATIDLIKKGLLRMKYKQAGNGKIPADARLDKKTETVLAAIVGVACLLVPIQMASQTWDDHDRSGRYTCRDFGQNYLMSLQDKGNPIVFTNGDNDTFPLWYNQEVEGVRTDARVCNLSYLQTDWYIDQMCRPAYNSPSVPITWPRLDYCSGTNDYISVEPEAKSQVLELYKQHPEEAKKQFGDSPFELKNVLKYWVRSKDKEMHFIPTDTLYLTIDKEAVRKSGMMMAADSIPDRMVISLKGKRNLYKGDLMMLEMLAQCNWTRPIYVACTVGADNYMNLGDNFIQEGLVNRITPFTTNTGDMKNFDTEKVYTNMMTRFKYGGLDKKGIYLDETVMRMCYTHRRLFAQLALHLISEGKNDKAAKALAYADKMIPAYNVPMTYMSGGIDIAKAYALIGQKAQAKKVLGDIFNNAWQYMRWYNSLNTNRFAMSQQECMMQIYIMRLCLDIAPLVDEKWADALETKWEMSVKTYQERGGQLPM
ncbi:DUF2723 domain-containing protein [Prevotella sp. PCHR]|uniref:DUF2723 domain-containing protein n=1 Tax=Xylanibacter caecicola TaxID=2736294 RepID=A0ABX2AZ57_9BACT|nr:DUF2723 domain-containing protein [Xylanibacter caecicola]NPE24276.1 DUF2723 domain-containing protein [Xylanibacter caecicola]